MRRNSNKKKIVNTILSVIMTAIIFAMAAVSDIVYALSNDGSALAEDRSEFMYYTTESTNCFDIKGKYNDRFIKTTYSDAGYRVGMKVGSGSKELVNLKNGQVTTVGGIDLQIKLEMQENGRSVGVSYILQNNSGSAKTVDIGSSGDTMIGDNDRAKVTRTSSGFEMTDDVTSNSTYGAKFSLTGDFTTTWIGQYSSAYDNMFNNASVSYVADTDSGLAYSWKVTIPNGQTVTKKCVFKVDSVLELGDCVVSADVANKQLIVKAPYTYQSGKIQQLNYSIDSGAFNVYKTTSTAGSDGTGVFNNIAIDVSALNWEPESTHTISFYINEIPSANSKLKTRTLTYLVYWPPTFSADEQQQTIKFGNSYMLFADVISKKGDTIILPSDAQNGYAFLGWDTKADGTGTRYPAGSEYYVNGNATLYAQWQRAYKASVITRIDDEISSDFVITLKNDIYGTYNNNSYVPAATYGLYVDGNDIGMSITVTDGAANKYIDYYTVSYDPADGTMDSVGTAVLLKGSTYKVSANDPVRICHIFNGWYLNGSSYNKDDFITVSNKIVLKAQWITNHQFGEYIYDNNATADKDGTSTRECSVCHTKESVTVSGTSNVEKSYENIINAYDEISKKSVTSDDKDVLDAIITESEALKSNECFKYLDDNKKGKLEVSYEYVTEKIKTLEAAANEAESLKSKFSALPDENSINTTYEKSVSDLKEEITKYLEIYKDELSANEKAYANDMLAKVTKFETKLTDVKENVKIIDETASQLSSLDTVKTTDENKLTEIKKNLQSILTQYNSNLTDEQVSKINGLITETNDKINRVSEIKSQLNNAKEEMANIPDVSDVASDDKTSLEEIKNKFTGILNTYGDNLTADQKREIEEAIEKTNDALDMIGLIDEKAAAVTEIDKTAKEAKEAIDAMDELSDAEKENAKKTIDDKAAAAKETIENITIPEDIQSVINIKADASDSIGKIKDENQTENNNIKGSEAIYVDEEGNTHYGTLKDIIENAPAGTNIIIKNDIIIRDNLVLDSGMSIDIPNDKKVTIEKGGTLEIKKGSKLINADNLTVKKDADFIVNGLVEMPIGEGNVSVIVSPDSNNETDNEIVSNINVSDIRKLIEASLDSETINNIESGYDVSLRLIVKATSENAAKEDVSTIRQYVDNYTLGNNKSLKVGKYLDIIYEVMINDGDWSRINETSEEIEITIHIPENLKGKEKYYIIRNHNGICTILDDLDDNPDTITFKTDCFSTYAISYEEAVTPSDDVNAGGMNVGMFIIIGFISMGMVCMAYGVRRKYNDLYC